MVQEFEEPAAVGYMPTPVVLPWGDIYTAYERAYEADPVSFSAALALNRTVDARTAKMQEIF